MVNPDYKVVPMVNFTMAGPVKNWRSVKQIHVYHYDVVQSVRRLFFTSKIKTQRVVCVEIQFNNGVRYASHGLFQQGRDKDISLIAIYRALREFSRHSRISPA